MDVTSKVTTLCKIKHVATCLDSQGNVGVVICITQKTTVAEI